MFVGTNSAKILAKLIVGKFCYACQFSIVYSAVWRGVPAPEMLIHTRNIEPVQKATILKLKKKKKFCTKPKWHVAVLLNITPAYTCQVLKQCINAIRELYTTFWLWRTDFKHMISDQKVLMRTSFMAKRNSINENFFPSLVGHIWLCYFK